MYKLLNQRRTIYWLTSFCCIIVGFFATIFGLLAWGTVSTIIGGTLILTACILGILAMRS